MLIIEGVETQMLKKILNKSEEDNKTIFPIQIVQGDYKERMNQMNNSDNLDYIVEQILANKDFILKVEQSITQQVLDTLLAKYNFEPTQKYLQDIELKKKYINQLDDYLDERKIVNMSVENDLQQFLNDTKNSLARALETFSDQVQARIVETESRYGIDKIKHILLDVEDNR